MTTFHATPTADTNSSVALVGAVSAVVASAGTIAGAHEWAEILVTVPLILVASGLIFGFVVPRALRKETAGGTALGLSIPAALLVLPAFWAGLPLLLGVAGMVVGNAGRNARSGSGKCVAALVLGALAVLTYVATYTFDLSTGGMGFLLD